MNELSAIQLRRALALREKIDQLESELSALLSGSAPGTTARRVPTPRLAWESVERRSGLATAKPRRRMSAATKARIAAAARKRWKRAKAAGKRTLAG